MSVDEPARFDRRSTLALIAATAAAPWLPTWAINRPISARGYGNDPNLNKPFVPWPLLLDSNRLQTIAMIADLILPASESSPAPSTLGVQDFLNEWVSAPYEEQMHDRALILQGLAWIDAESERRVKTRFLSADHGTRAAILADIAADSLASGDPRAASEFFLKLRFLIVAAYYTTPEGWADIGYVGNVPLASYPPITVEERSRLDVALARLGLTGE
jgi:Gluconate 2-dehydrogenase subunit 3